MLGFCYLVITVKLFLQYISNTRKGAVKALRVNSEQNRNRNINNRNNENNSIKKHIKRLLVNKR